MGQAYGRPAPGTAQDGGEGGGQEKAYKALVTGTVYELYAPTEGDPAVDVVFFHGLQLGDGSRAWHDTWTGTKPGDGSKFCWPAELLPADFPRARVLSLCYDTAARQRHGKEGVFDLKDLGEYLLGALPQAGVGQRPLLLVGHSLGGLVLKQFLVEANARASMAADPAEKRAAGQLLANVLGAAFYSTPHAGSRLGDYAAVLSGLRIVAAGEVMRYLCTLSKDAFRVNAPFQDLRTREGWKTLGFCEMHATSAGPFNAVVVEQASGLQDMDTRQPINADHGGVCKPTSASDLAYARLRTYLEERLRERDQVLLEAARQPLMDELR